MKVELIYFKPTGKYYSEGALEVADDLSLYAIWSIIGTMRHQQTLPGLVSHHSPYHILINVPEHEHAHPYLLLLEAASR